MGSQETIETAFRCGAYAAAITPKFLKGIEKGAGKQ
jgi:hypothetical protein